MTIVTIYSTAAHCTRASNEGYLKVREDFTITDNGMSKAMEVS